MKSRKKSIPRNIRNKYSKDIRKLLKNKKITVSAKSIAMS